MNKNILLASFVFPERKEWFINYLQTKFKVKTSDIFIYNNLTDSSKLVIVFKLIIPKGEHLDFKVLFPSAVQVHKKNNCIYSINALNKLIDTLHDKPVTEIDYKSFKLDWSQYQDKLILTTKNDLIVSDIKAVF